MLYAGKELNKHTNSSACGSDTSCVAPLLVKPMTNARHCRCKNQACSKASKDTEIKHKMPILCSTKSVRSNQCYTGSRVCNSLVQIPSSWVEMTRQMLPTATSKRGPFASKYGPIWTPQKNERNEYMEKIHDTWPSEYSDS